MCDQIEVLHVTWDSAVPIYAIMTGVPIDVGILVYSTMIRTASHRSYVLWFQSPINTLCMEAGLVLENEMEILPGGSYIVPSHQ